MSREISSGTKLRLFSGNGSKEFVIESKKGAGGSCAAYVVSFYEADEIRHKGILKEYCPAYLGDVKRNSDNSIVIPVDLRQRFDKGLKDFMDTYRFINNYIAENEAASNYHPVQLGLYEGNNTLYTLSSCDFGKTYDLMEDESLHSVIRLMISVTKAVEMYHCAGFVHCDIKPENIFILDGVTDLIKLFDYDSLLSIDELRKGAVSVIPDPSIYYVPELVGREQRKIGIATDIFEIGAMLYYRLFGKAPTAEQMEHDSVFDLENTALTDGISPKAKYELEKLFRNTLRISARRRYATTKELIGQLELILDNLDNKKPYLLNLPVWRPARIRVERDAELNDIHAGLLRDGFVFIKGMGGLGKSELSKMYVDRYRQEYHTVQFCKYVDSIKTMVASMPISGVNDEDYDNIDDLFKAKNKILHQCDSHTMIVVDNFNVTYDKHLRDFLPSDAKGFKVIFTTRCMPASDYYENNVLRLSALSSEDSRRLFYLHTQSVRTPEADAKIDRLVNEIQYNTLLLVLIAKLIKRTNTDIDIVIQKLEEQELKTLDAKVFYEYDYPDEDLEVYNKINNHLHTVFNISGLSYAEKQVLVDMTLICVYGIVTDDFIGACDDKDVSAQVIDALISRGWIEENNKTISLHTIVSDVISELDIEKNNSYYSLACYLEDQCDVEEDTHISILHKALAIAKQLDRRYKTEDDETQAVISFILGTVYLSLYRPKDAEKCLLKAVLISKAIDCEYLLAVAYLKLGDHEAKFGTTTKAVPYYNEAIKTTESLCDHDESGDSYYGIIIDAMRGIADCYENNNELSRAVQQYKDLLSFVTEHEIDLADLVIKEIIRLSEETDDQRDIDYYSELLTKYEESPTEEEESFDQIISRQIDSGDFRKARIEYEKLLSEAREEYGEESPFYQDLAKYRCVYYLINDDIAEADRLMAEDMAFIGSTYGEKSVEMADFLSVLSIHMIDKTRIKYGLELAERAVSICEALDQKRSYVYAKAKMAMVTAYVTLGDSYAAGKIAEGLDLDRFSGSDYLSDIIRSIGLAYIELGFYDEIINISNKVIKSKNIDRLSRVIAYELLLIYHDQKGETDKALSYLNKVKKQIDELSTSKYAKAYLLTYYRFAAKIASKKQKDEEALSYIDKAINLFEDKSAYLLLRCYQDRSLYHSFLKDYSSAESDFERCKEIVDKYGLYPKINIPAYNNAAVVYYKKEEYSEAEKCYEKILELQPDIISRPSSYTEAMICLNYGWIKYILDDAKTAEEYISSAISYFEANGFGGSQEYLTAKNNLSIIYMQQQKLEQALPLLLEIRDKIETVRDNDSTNVIRIHVDTVSGLLASDKAQEAYDFAVDSDKKLAKKYGKKSPERIDYLQRVSGTFKYFGYLDAFEFLEKASKLIKTARLEHSILQAAQLNYLGVAFWDLNKDPNTAKDLLEQAKNLLEELGAQSLPLYELVCNNLKLAEEEVLNDLIKRMAENMTGKN